MNRKWRAWQEETVDPIPGLTAAVSPPALVGSIAIIAASRSCKGTTTSSPVNTANPTAPPTRAAIFSRTGFVFKILRKILNSVFHSPTRAIERFQDARNRAVRLDSDFFPGSPCVMPGFLDNFRQPFHNSQNRRGTVSLAVRYPLEIGLWAAGRRRRPGNSFCGFRPLLAPPVRPWSKKVASETNRKSKGSFQSRNCFLEFSQHEVLYICFCSLLRHHCHAGAE